MAAKYKHKHAAFGRQVNNSAFMVAAMRARAERGKAAAEAVAGQHAETGLYAGSFYVESHAGGGVKGDRAEARVRSNRPNAAAIEFGHVTPKGKHVDGVGALAAAAAVMS